MHDDPAGRGDVQREGDTAMLKKAKQAAAKEKPKGESKDLAQAVLDSSHQIWLAGVGAFVRAREEGTKAFETLVRQGEKLEQRTKHAAAQTAAAARGAATAKAKEMQQMAGGTWDKLEQVFEDRVARALGKLGVYTQNDVQKLAERVDALSAAVNELLMTTGTRLPPSGRAKKAPVSSRARRKPAKKRGAAKKSSPK
jgi:poly(hydroxyalkanoate) granule-associated protein